MWANRRLASISVRGDDPDMRPGEIFAPRPLRRVAKRVESFYWGSGLCDDVPALAWYLVGACVPLTLGIAALASLVLGDGARAEHVATRLASVLPPGARDEVVDLVLRTHRNSPLLLAVAVASMVWAGAGATGVVERVESRLLGAPRLGPIALKLRHLGLAAGMVLMIALMAAAATEATNLRGRLGFPVPGWLLSVVSALLIAAICSLLYRYATTRRLSWRAGASRWRSGSGRPRADAADRRLLRPSRRRPDAGPGVPRARGAAVHLLPGGAGPADRRRPGRRPGAV